jgi:hypothetical protein
MIKKSISFLGLAARVGALAIVLCVAWGYTNIHRLISSTADKKDDGFFGSLFNVERAHADVPDDPIY